MKTPPAPPRPQSPQRSGSADPLERLAAAYGVATTYEDWARRPVPVAAETVRTVLGLLGVDPADAADPADALAARDRHSSERALPPTIVVNDADLPKLLPTHLPPAVEPVAVIELEEGGRQPVEITGSGSQALLHLPHGLPLGYHRLRLSTGESASSAQLIVVPAQIADPAGGRRAWGWMVQLYAIRSAGSWGLGDYEDLRQLAIWSAKQGADLLLVNPVHAPAPTLPQQNSPYFPASRRFSSPLYLRPQTLPEYAAAPADMRRQVDDLAASVPSSDLIDRDATWQAKRAALQLLFSQRAQRPEADASAALDDFALWCALADRHGPDWRVWPEELRDPKSKAVDLVRDSLDAEIEFHRWLQHCCDEQLAAAQSAAVAAGMSTGLVHDLAVGVDPAGADAWALQSELAVGAAVGAPPDSFNQQGQNWGLPPWRPDRLAETGYAPYREMVQAVLRRGGGMRVDHILGLFRLWWVPQEQSAADGTYVSYDAAAMLGILALEAVRSGGLIVGEDLGTVPPQASAALAERGVLGSVVLWFERDDPDDETVRFTAPQAWRELAMASVSTHDLPTAEGFLAGEHVRARADLGLLGRPREQEAAAAQREKEALLELMRAERLLPAQPSTEDIILAMHKLLLRSPARVVLASPADAVGDLRQPNLPGTTDEYPSWRLPIADSSGEAVSYEELRDDPRVARLARLLTEGCVAKL
jgi:4-alpha-glucanotransferase